LNFGDIFGVMALTFNNLPALITGFGLKIPFAGPICTVGGAEAPDAVAWAITVVPSEPREKMIDVARTAAASWFNMVGRCFLNLGR
jgi:hypothetical protein